MLWSTMKACTAIGRQASKMLRRRLGSCSTSCLSRGLGDVYKRQVQRLLDAQQRLIEHDPSLRLSIFDAWRPIAVQAFMVDHSIAELCRKRGVEVRSGDAFDQVVADAVSYTHLTLPTKA